jgi:hypothetical protein
MLLELGYLISYVTQYNQLKCLDDPVTSDGCVENQKVSLWTFKILHHYK